MFLCRAWVLSKYSGFLPQSKDMHVKVTGDSKLSSYCRKENFSAISIYKGMKSQRAR